jgi:ribosomal protein S18 acetylase RimI-like enzyme
MAPPSTADPEVASGWSAELFGDANPIEFFLDPARFAYACRTRDSMSLTLDSASPFGIALGPEPPLRAEWTGCIVGGSASAEHIGPLHRSDQWDFYTRPSAGSSPVRGLEVIVDDLVVRGFLERNAPASAVWPGDREIVAWFALRDQSRELASISALVRWQSGYHVISSVATRLDARGRGFAGTLVNATLANAHERGIAWLGLGVSHANVTAQRVYQRAGFTLRANFTNYSTSPSKG